MAYVVLRQGMWCVGDQVNAFKQFHKKDGVPVLTKDRQIATVLGVVPDSGNVLLQFEKPRDLQYRPLTEVHRPVSELSA